MLDTTIRAGRAPLLALATAASVVALTATAPQANAAFVIDDFSSPTPANLLPQLPDSNGTSDPTDDVAVPGTTDGPLITDIGTATRTITRTGPTATIGDPSTYFVPATNTTVVGEGSLVFNNGFEDQVTTLSYVFDSAIDLASFNKFSFNFASTDSDPLSGNANFPISVGVTNATGGASAFEVQSFDLLDEDGVGGTVETLLFSAYSSIEFSEVTGIEVVLDNASFTGAPDFRLDSIAAVPLPGALPLFLGGLAGVGYVVRRRQRQAAAA